MNKEAEKNEIRRQEEGKPICLACQQADTVFFVME